MGHLHLLTPRALSFKINIFSHLKLCFATAIHNFKWQKMYVDLKKSVATFLNVTDSLLESS